jgi:hypothetical protein
MHLASTTFDSPVGLLTLVASDVGLVAVMWESDDPLRVRLGPLTPTDAHPILTEATRQLRGYFAGERTTFDLPLDMRGTDFQKSVWAALLAIPMARPAATPRSRASSADRAPAAPWARRTGEIRYRSSRPATAWSARAAI